MGEMFTFLHLYIGIYYDICIVQNKYILMCTFDHLINITGSKALYTEYIGNSSGLSSCAEQERSRGIFFRLRHGLGFVHRSSSPVLYRSHLSKTNPSWCLYTLHWPKVIERYYQFIPWSLFLNDQHRSLVTCPYCYI